MKTEDKIIGYARKWHVDGEIPKKEKNENGRMVFPRKFSFMPLSERRLFKDDLPVYLKAAQPVEAGK